MPHFALDKSVRVLYFMRRRQRRRRRSRPQTSVCFRYVCVYAIWCVFCLLHFTATTVWVFAAVLLVCYGSSDFRFDSCFIIYIWAKKHSTPRRVLLCCVVLCCAVWLFCVFILFFTSFLQSINNWLFTDGGKRQCAVRCRCRCYGCLLLWCVSMLSIEFSCLWLLGTKRRVFEC